MERKGFSKHDQVNYGDKNEFIGKKRFENNSEHSYSRERNQNYIRHNYDYSKL